MSRIVVATALLLLAGPAGAQNTTPAVIVTSGDGVVRRAPDVAFVTVGVTTRSKSPRDAQRQNGEAMTALVARLSGMGLPRDALRTTGVRLGQEYDGRTPRGYVARNSLEARVDEIDRVGEVADAAVQAGATELGGIRFDLKDRNAVEREALGLAIKDARARADAAAAAAGVSIDRVLRIEDGSSMARPIQPRTMGMEAATVVGGAGVVVEPGLIEVRATASVTVSIK